MANNSREAKGGWLYEENGDGVVIVGYKGKSKKITVPSTVDGKPVIGIGKSAFYNIGLTEVTIPDSVTRIGISAFEGNKIASLSLGSGLITIEDKAFYYSGLTAVSIPDSVTSIGKEAFGNNQITDLSLGSGVVTIQDKAFQHNKLAGTLTLPPNITAVGGYAFYQNDYTEVIAPGSIAVGPLAFGKTAKLTTASGEKPATSSYKAPAAPPKSAAAAVQKEGCWLFTTNANTVVITGYEGTAPVVSIPAQIQGMPVVEIGERAFLSKGLTSVTIPGSVAIVGKRAFALNELTSITIENGVKSIGEEAFEKPTRFNEDVSKIANVSIPPSMTKIGDRAFQRSRIASITISKGVESIGKEAFMGNQLKSVTIPEGVVEIQDKAFEDNFIESVSLPNSLTIIGEKTFEGGKNSNKLTVLKLPTNLETLYNGAFSGNKLTEIVIPASLKTIGESTFSANELARITIPEGVKSIEAKAFANNKLALVSLPASVTSIGEEAFKSNKLSGDISIPETVKTIGKGAYSYNELTGVEIRGTTKIGPDAFGDNQISKIIIGSCVPSIGGGAFTGNNPLVGATIPDSVKITEANLKGQLAAFSDHVYIAKGETDGLKFNDASYWQSFEQKIATDKEAKTPKRQHKSDTGKPPITFHNEKGQQIGSANFSDVFDSAIGGSYRGGRAKGEIFDMKNSRVGKINIYAPFAYTSVTENYAVSEGCFVTVDGVVLNTIEDAIVSHSDGTLKSGAESKLEQYRIGKVKAEGAVGVAYNKDGVKLGEVRNAGEFAAVYAGAMLKFLIK